MSLPACGLYKTTVPIAGIEAGRLVFFHNHGNPGPGLYLPASWTNNRAAFAEQGSTLEQEELAATLEPLAPEGLYRVTESFDCCENHCRTYEREMLLQLGYNGAAEPIVFVPSWTEAGLVFPKTGQRVDVDRVKKLALLTVGEPQAHGQPTVNLVN